MIESPHDAVPHELMELHVKLLRKIRKSVSAEKWERALIKFCHSYYCNEEGWELERCGYKKCKVSVKLRILKTLCDAQFDLNAKLKTDVNKLTAEELRLEPLGKDKVGQAYWCQFDPAANVRVYKEDQDEETWKLVARDRESLVDLITQLSSGEELLDMDLMNEDSNSQEIEKPITDTGQLEASTSEENSTDNSNYVLKDENVTKQEDVNESEGHSNGLKENSQNESCIQNGSKPEQIQKSDFEDKLPHISNNSQGTVMGNKSRPDENNVNLTSGESFKKEKEDTHLETKLEYSKSLEQSQHSTHSISNQILVAESSKNMNTTKEENPDLRCSADLPLVKNNSESQIGQVNEEHKNTSVLPAVECSGSADSAKEHQKSSNHSDYIAKSEHGGTETAPISVGRKRKPDELEDRPSKKLFTKEDLKGVETSEKDTTNEEKRNEREDKTLVEEGDVGNEIEEPVMVFKGEGSGNDCDTENPGIENEVGEEIEEPIMIFVGEGSGHECDTGNPGLESEEKSKAEEGTHRDSDDVKDLVENKTNLTSFDSKTSLFDNGVNKLKGALHDNNKKETLSSKIENDDSIERNLSALTGESYSSNEEKQIITEIDGGQVSNVADCPIERGIRRKSCSEDTESEPPEAKKTKVENIDYDVEGKIESKNTVVGKEPNIIGDKFETNNGVDDVPNVSNISNASKGNNCKETKSSKLLEKENGEGTIVSKTDEVGLTKGDSKAEHEKINCTIPTEKETVLKQKTVESNLTLENSNENDKLLQDLEGNKPKINVGELANTNETSTNKLNNDATFSKSETKKDTSDQASCNETDIPENSENLSPSKSDIEEESKQKEPNSSKKKSTPKKSPRPRKKLFTGRRSRKKSKKPPEGTGQPVNSDEEDLKSKLSKLEDEECKARNKKKQTDSDNEQSPNNKKANVANKVDSKPSLVASRKRRGSQIIKDKESEEDASSDKKDEDDEEEEEVGGKKRKLKGKRSPNKSLRKSIEEKRNGKSSSEDDTNSDSNDKAPSKKSKNATSVNFTKKEDDNEESKQTPKKKNAKLTGPNSRKYSGIEINVDLIDSGRSKRQSSRLAQLKIREQSDSKHAYEMAQQQKDKPGKKSKKKREEGEEKQRGSSKKKKIKNKNESDEDEDFLDEDTDKKKGKRKKKNKDPVRAFNQRDPWKYESSSGSSSENEEEEDHYDIVEEEEELPATLKSDHEFSPESDIENDEEWKPVRHARTAQKREPKIEAEGEKKVYDDFACEKCGKKDHPEWILLCDSCDLGWHASCLRPSLMLVPEGDWHCPPCQHIVLVKKLQETLRIFDRDTKKRENEELRKKRLAYVGISLDNVLPANAIQPPRERERGKGSGSESSEVSGSRSGSESESDSDDEPVYQLRQRRQGTQSYRFNEYDDLINSAIQDEVGVLNPPAIVVPEGQIVPALEQAAEEQPKLENAEVNSTVADKELPLVVSKPEKVDKPKKKEKTESGDDSSSSEEDESEDEEEEFPSVVPKRNNVMSRPGKRKPRKLNSLDDPSDDDDDDEDFKGSSSEEDEEEDGSDDSDDSEIGGRGRSKRGNRGPVRRSSRARKSRFDKEFINDDSEDSDGPKRKKKKKVWTETDSDSEDSTWGRRKKKKNLGPSNRKKSKNKKFVIDDELSGSEAKKVPKQKRQRKIKYGGLDDLEVEDLPSRRTRGRAINYQEVIGSDSEEEIISNRKKKVVIEDDDEFVAEKEEEKEDSEGESDDDEEDEDDDEEKDSSEDEKDEENKKDKTPIKKDLKEPKLVTNEPKPVKPEQKPIILDKKGEITPIKLPPKPVTLPESLPVKTSPPLNNVIKEKPRRGRPPKAMIAPPPERLITEDDQYKAIVSKVATLGHTEHFGVNVGQPKLFPDTVHPVTPIKMQNTSFDPKLKMRSPPIKIRSGVPVNASGRRSPSMLSPTNETPYFPVKSPPMANSENLGPLRKSLNPHMNINVKSENAIEDEEDLDDEDLMDDIEEDEEEEYSDDEVLEEGEIPKKVAKRMERLEQKLEEKRLEKLKTKVQQGPNIMTNNPAAAVETKPTQPLLRVVSPLKLMANPPGPLQTSFMNPGLNPRIGSPPLTRMGIRPPQPQGGMPLPVGGMEDATKRRGRGRGKKPPGQDNPEPEMVAPGGSVIQGMLQQPQSYPPTHFPPQRFPPPHPRIPFSPQRMMRPPFHPSHHPMDPSPSGGGPVKQEPVTHPPPPTPHSTAPPFHPPHRYDPRPAPPNYGPGKPAQYFPPPVHYGNYPPPPPPQPMAPRDEPPPQTYPVQQPYNEQYPEEAPAAAPTTTSTSKDEESSGGEFGGLVSYFSSQREDDIDT